jgi:hypothetical protein
VSCSRLIRDVSILAVMQLRLVYFGRALPRSWNVDRAITKLSRILPYCGAVLVNLGERDDYFVHPILLGGLLSNVFLAPLPSLFQNNRVKLRTGGWPCAVPGSE